MITRFLIGAIIVLLSLQLSPALAQWKENGDPMSTAERISLKSEYFCISTGTAVGMGDGVAEMEYLRKWKSKAVPVMEKIRVTLEKRIKAIQLDLNLPLLKYDKAISREVVEEGIDPESVRNLVEFGESNRPFRYLMRLKNLPKSFDPIDYVSIEVIFSTLPARSTRISFKKTLVSLITGQPITQVEEAVLGAREKIDLPSTHVRVSTSVIAKEEDVGPEIEFLRVWWNKTSPLIVEIRNALEKEIEALERCQQFPLLQYSDTFWAVPEEEIYPEGVSLVVREQYKPPFRYQMRFHAYRIMPFLDKYYPEYIDVEVGVSTLPEKSVRDGLKRHLEGVIKRVMADHLHEHVVFGEYQPKREPDTVYDYLPNTDRHQEYEDILRNLPTAELKNLEKLHILFDEYSEKAKKNPGSYVEGNILLGAKPRQYEPSGDELVLAEIGNRIKSIVNTTPKDQLKKHMLKEKIILNKIEYNTFTFTHADVMGSGRFFYASDPIKEEVSFELEQIMKKAIPEQKIVLPEGYDVTADYLTAARREFRECLQNIFLEIAKRAFKGETQIAEAVIENALTCQRRYFQAMKGGINITEEHVKTFVIQEIEQQQRFYAALRTLADKFKKEGVTFEIFEPGGEQYGWNTGLTVGCSINAYEKYWATTYLAAIPLVSAKDIKVPGTIPAKVLFVDQDCVVLLTYPLPAAVTRLQSRSAFGPVKDVEKDFPTVRKAWICNNFLLLDWEKTLSKKEFESLKKKYRVIAIVKENSKSNEALIYTGRDEVPLHIQLELKN